MKKIFSKINLIIYSIIFSLFLIWLLASQSWPVAFVNYTPITYKEFKNYYLLSRNYYESSLKIQKQDLAILNKAEIKSEIKGIALTALIGNKLIEQDLDQKFKSAELDKKIENKLAIPEINSDNARKGAEVLYGVSGKQFNELILMPKAKQEILEEILSANDKNFNDWFFNKSRNSSIIILMPQLYWEGTGVKIKSE